MKENPGTLSWIRRVIGLDYAEGQPVVVQAERRGAGVTWRPLSLDAVSRDAPNPDLCVAGLRVGPGISTWLTTSLQDVRKVRQVLPSVLDTKLPFALEDCVYAFSSPVAGTEPGLPFAVDGTAALSVVVRRSDLAVLERGYADVGLVPDLFDHEGVALWSGLVAGAAAELRVIVWCRPTAMLLVLGMGAAYWSSHHVAGHDLEHVMRIIRVQKQTIAKGAYKDAPLAWHIGGDEERVATFMEDLAGVPAPQKAVLPDGRYYLARVLAERALLPGAWRLPPIVGSAGESRYGALLRRRYVKDILICLILAALLLVSVVGRGVYVRHQMRKQEAVIVRTVQSVVGYATDARGQHAVQIAEGELAAQRALLDGFRSAPDLAVLGGRVAATVASEGGYVQHLVLAPAAAQIRVWLPAGNGADSLLRLLADHGFGRVQVERLDERDGKVLLHLSVPGGQP